MNLKKIYTTNNKNEKNTHTHKSHRREENIFNYLMCVWHDLKKPFFLPFNLFLLLFMDLTVLLRISNDHMFLSFKSNLDKINSHFLYLCLTKRKKWNTFQDFKTKMLIIQTQKGLHQRFYFLAQIHKEFDTTHFKRGIPSTLTTLTKCAF